MPTAQETFREFVKALAALLRGGGWKKSRNNFHRRHGELDQRIELEKSMYSDRALVKYRAWIQVGSPTVAERPHLLSLTERKYAAIQFSSTIGPYLSDRSDWWGTLGGDDDPSVAARAFADLLEMHVFPVLDRYRTDESLIEPTIASLRGPPPNPVFRGGYTSWAVVGVLLCTRGRGSEFLALVDELRATESTHTLVADTVAAVRREFGL